MKINNKILVVTPRFPYPEAGACEQDRADGFRQLQRLGYDVKVIGKFFQWQKIDEIIDFWEKEGIQVIPTPYILDKIGKMGKIKRLIKNPYCLDGSALEYTDNKIISILNKELDSFKPNYVWFDYTYLWPLYKYVKKRNIPIIARSINFEARHFLEEDGRSFINYIKYIPKYITEIITARKSDIVFSITPFEEKMYQRAGAKKAVNLPLRSLYKKLNTHAPKETENLHVFFSGSTYNVSHNRRALEFIIKDLAPKIYNKFGSKFIFHITGSKFPEDLKKYIVNNVVYEGFVEDMNKFLENMDIALVPSLYGAGMQQKIFEPLSRGFPTITHKRGLADYDFEPGRDVLTGESVNDFIEHLEDMASFELRKKLSKNCQEKSQKQFSKIIIDSIVSGALDKIKN